MNIIVKIAIEKSMGHKICILLRATTFVWNIFQNCLVFFKKNVKNHDFYGFHHENRLFSDFRNQRVEIRKYG